MANSKATKSAPAQKSAAEWSARISTLTAEAQSLRQDREHLEASIQEVALAAAGGDDKAAARLPKLEARRVGLTAAMAAKDAVIAAARKQLGEAAEREAAARRVARYDEAVALAAEVSSLAAEVEDYIQAATGVAHLYLTRATALAGSDALGASAPDRERIFEGLRAALQRGLGAFAAPGFGARSDASAQGALWGREPVL